VGAGVCDGWGVHYAREQGLIGRELTVVSVLGRGNRRDEVCHGATPADALTCRMVSTHMYKLNAHRNALCTAANAFSRNGLRSLISRMPSGMPNISV
jgi:hypothetical protein